MLFSAANTNSMNKKTLASDNYSGVLPEIMQALHDANEGHAAAYGADEYTERATHKFKQLFGDRCEVFFVYNGTGANVLGLSASTNSYNSIICAELAHINVDESTAPEKFTGCKLLTIASRDGKIYPNEVVAKLIRVNDQHHAQPRMISVSQPTEYGTVYSVEEIKALSSVAKHHNLYLHMDGARIANAAVHLQKEFRAFTVDAGVDVLSFGGTKNGMMFGEAVILFSKEQLDHFPYLRKQSMQLHSKMRFIAAQFEALLTDDLWKRTAIHTNCLAQQLATGLRETRDITITQSVDANGVFALFPPAIIADLQNEMFFYVWNEQTHEVRLMCSFDTTQEEIFEFIKKVREKAG